MEKKIHTAQMNRFNSFFRLLFFFALLLFFLNPKQSLAASFSFSPISDSYSVGDEFFTKVLVKTLPNESINAVSGTVSFPINLLDVSSIVTEGGIARFWTESPSFSIKDDNNGTVNFEGLILNPGWTGDQGTVLTIRFKVKSAGLVEIAFSRGAILANDGNATNVLTDMGKIQTMLNNSNRTQIQTDFGSTTLAFDFPPKPEIKSSFSDQKKWYSDDSPEFFWDLPADVDDVRLLYDNSQYSKPTVSYGPLSKKALSGIEDGTWYFHLQFHNLAGWGPIAHFSFHIDTSNPDFLSVTYVSTDVKNSAAKFIIQSHDSGSAIDYFEMQVDSRPVRIQSGGDSIVFVTKPGLALGKHILKVKAYDLGGNFISKTVPFVISRSAYSPKGSSFLNKISLGSAIVGSGSIFSTFALFLYNLISAPVTIGMLIILVLFALLYFLYFRR